MVKRNWTRTNDAKLETIRLRDLRLKIEDSPLQGRIERLYQELSRRGIEFRPHVWFSTDWFSPDSVPGIAVPFYLGHPRLAHFERRRHVIAEGWNERECLRLLRHEAGHAIDTAYGLARHAAWREVFGPRNTPYHGTYRVNPFSRDHVRHLPRWYAQSHPAEDFAETFAIWLSHGTRPGKPGTLAKRKLELVAHLMREVCGRHPKGLLRERPYSLAKSVITLGEHYLRKEKERGGDPAPPFEPFLVRYAQPGAARGRSGVAAHVMRLKPRVRASLERNTHALPYDIDQILDGMVSNARMHGLRWKTRHRPRAAELAACVRTCWNKLRRGTTFLPR
jgi:hypothetical protein